MNEKAMMHVPESKYCFAPDENRVRLRLRISKTDFPDKVRTVYGGKYSFATERETAEMTR